ncbi:SRPBCC family protein [Halobacillus sp. Marseille-Q1614]|uniref:SRPBCC family protein n=1 Tax=Halobacillus sp. Marseille-Q1614 TaxID=2709134 RepID=UPI00156E6E77|nr:SRPBCC family protein [Halobacillus sp. Marseille-Q1614]
MITWREETMIDANIEEVWELFRDKNIKKIMPKVEEQELIEKSEEEAGAKHKQTYREGKRLETYIVHTLAYNNLEDKKHKKINFIIGKAFEITLSFTLIKMDDHETKFIYEGENKGINFVGRAMMKLANKKGNNKVVFEFLERVRQEAENAG